MVELVKKLTGLDASSSLLDSLIFSMISFKSSDICFNWESIISANWYLKQASVHTSAHNFNITKILTFDFDQYQSQEYPLIPFPVVQSIPPTLFAELK